MSGKLCLVYSDMFYVTQFPTLPSTNDYVKEHGMALDDHTVVWAHEQTKGRGRFERQWKSGNDLTFSIVFHKRSMSHAILAPLAVVFALENLKLSTMIKWPNDILYKGKKCAGILVERIYSGDQYFDVVGIGVNFSASYGKDLEYKAISLPDHLDQEDVLYRILNMYQMLLRMDHASILRQYRKYNALIGQKIHWQGEDVMVKDLNEQGELIIERETTKVVVNSGEITLDMWYQRGAF